MTEINVPLLQKVLDHITAHPEEHRFSSENTLAEIWRIASRMTDGAIEVPDQFRDSA